jgi:hypothetical protein
MIKKFLYTIALSLLINLPMKANELNCDSVLSKLKPSCNFIGKGKDKLNAFSKKNKTIGDTYRNIKKKKK